MGASAVHPAPAPIFPGSYLSRYSLRTARSTAVAVIEHRMATAVTTPKVMAAPLFSAIELAIIPAMPATQTTATTLRMAPALTPVT